MTGRLDHEAAVEATRRMGFAPAAAERWLQSGWVRTSDTSQVVAAASEDVVLGTSDLYVPAVEVDPPSDEALREALRRLLEQDGPADRIVVRTEPGRALPCGRQLLAFLDRPTTAGYHRCGRCEITRVDATTIGLVHELLADAILQGYRTCGLRPDPDTVVGYVRATFADLGAAGSPYSCLVGQLDGRALGHLTVRLDERDDVTDAVVDEIVDVHLGADAQHTPCLLATFHSLRRGRQPLRGNVVTGNPRWRAVRDRLVAEGWQDSFALWAVVGDDLRTSGGGLTAGDGQRATATPSTTDTGSPDCSRSRRPG